MTSLGPVRLHRRTARACQRVRLGEGLLQIGDELILGRVFLLAFADVAAVDDHPADRGVVEQIVGPQLPRRPTRAVGVAGAVLKALYRSAELGRRHGEFRGPGMTKHL